MSGSAKGDPHRNEIRASVMGLGEELSRKSYYPQLQARIRELEEHKAHLEAKSSALSKMLEQLEEARRKAEDNERRFRDLADLLPQTVFEIDLAGRMTFANRIAFVMFGFAPPSLQTGLDFIDTLVPEDRNRARANIEKTFNGEDLRGQQYSALRADGTKFPCIVYATAINTGTEVTGLRGIVVDITEQVQLREQKDAIEAQYHQAQKMEAIGRLAGGVAHDFNNLLCPILGYSELLLGELSPSDGRRKGLEAIQSAGLKARQLVHQLLAFGRKQILEVKLMELNSVIARFETLLQRVLREDIDIQLLLCATTSGIRADVGQIEQVLMNLVVNAQDAMPDGGRITIETATVYLDETYAGGHHSVTPGPYVMLAVSDTGHGMDAETRERIFEPFFTTKAHDKGTGLGLATVYGIVKQHDGIIYVYSEPGKGTTFKIYFPALNGSLVHSAVALQTVEQNRGTETVLVAEDCDMVRNLMVPMLALQGYSVLAAATGTECLQSLEHRDGPIDLLITDVIMPDMNGMALYQQVITQCPDALVLYMSGYTEDVIVHHGVLKEGIAFLQKPFTARGLAAKVREVLDNGVTKNREVKGELS